MELLSCWFFIQEREHGHLGHTGTGGRSSPPAANHNVGADEQAAHRQKVIEVVGFMEEHAKHKMSQQQYRDAVELFDDALQLLLSCKNVDSSVPVVVSIFFFPGMGDVPCLRGLFVVF
mgnify:FL=1